MDLNREKDLVERARQDPQAFGELYEQYYSPIFGYILKRTASIDVAQDITSEVFFKAFYNLKQFIWREIPFSAWLYRIAINEIANHYRHNNHRLSALKELFNSTDYSGQTIENEISEAEAELNKHAEFLALQANISKLPVKYQEVITLRYFENKQLKEIAEILNNSEGTVKSLLHRGLEKLQIAMEHNATFQ
jgi:RNA polymerase sigma factor (sigma-70 family)